MCIISKFIIEYSYMIETINSHFPKRMNNFIIA